MDGLGLTPRTLRLPSSNEEGPHTQRQGHTGREQEERIERDLKSFREDSKNVRNHQQREDEAGSNDV